jgi:hypothetical protein
LRRKGGPNTARRNTKGRLQYDPEKRKIKVAGVEDGETATMTSKLVLKPNNMLESQLPMA